MDIAMLLIRKTRRYIYFVLCLLLTSCADYSFNINNKEVYSPPRLFNDFDIADSGLRNCIQQTITDQKITSAEELKNLTCSHAGIQSLAGLSEFSRITRLNLSSNQIGNIDELLTLTHLEELDISENPIESCQTLSQLEQVITGRFIHNHSCP